MTASPIIETNKNIQDYNTFLVPAVAAFFAVVDSPESLISVLGSTEYQSSKHHLMLGGGSNMLFTSDYNGFIIKNEIKGIQILEETDTDVLISVGAGESWHSFVMWSVDRGYWGIENLAYIPGTVGGAPVQNIGAYGTEVQSSIESVEYVDLDTGHTETKSATECEFTYRSSIFKTHPKKWMITGVIFQLQKNGTPVTGYGRVAESLADRDITDPTPRDIADIIIDIRKSKLPDVGEIGMAGSFFKNPIVSEAIHNNLIEKFPDMPSYDVDLDGIPMKKIPAGWMLETLGYKGFQSGNVGNYHKHALVITHNGQGTGAEVWEHIQNVITRVEDTFGVTLEPEVNIMGNEK